MPGAACNRPHNPRNVPVTQAHLGRVQPVARRAGVRLRAIAIIVSGLSLIHI